MKPFLILFALSIHTIAGTLPPDAAAIKATRDAKLSELNAAYVRALEKTKRRAMNDGDIEGAQEIEKEMDRAAEIPTIEKSVGVRAAVEGSSWKHSEKGWVITFRSDGKISKSWGKLTPKWFVRNERIAVEDSVFQPTDDANILEATGGDKSGKWVKLD